jgi:hypothetical protein
MLYRIGIGVVADGDVVNRSDDLPLDRLANASFAVAVTTDSV